jgi:pimeloyl-ACP methyl ester carboxylesterase
MVTEHFTTPSGDVIAHEYTHGAKPLVVFLGGFKSDMTGTKALALQAVCEARGQAFLRFDYHGHGQSSGTFREGTIGRWKQNALDIITHVMAQHGHEQVVLVGSSMGGWIMLHIALSLGEKVKAMVGLAAAPDFVSDLIFHELSAAQHKEIKDKGETMIPSCYGEDPYPITRALMEDGEEQVVLRGAMLQAITCPVRLIHGTNDEDVPYKTSLKLMDALGSEDVLVHYIKNGDHRLSAPHQLKMICDVVESVL